MRAAQFGGAQFGGAHFGGGAQLFGGAHFGAHFSHAPRRPAPRRCAGLLQLVTHRQEHPHRHVHAASRELREIWERREDEEVAPAFARSVFLINAADKRYRRKVLSILFPLHASMRRKSVTLDLYKRRVVLNATCKPRHAAPPPPRRPPPRPSPHNTRCRR